MIKLGRLMNWVLPELIHLDPTVATACYGAAVAEDERTRSSKGRRALVPGGPRASIPIIRFRLPLLTLVLAAGAALITIQPVAASTHISVAGTFFFVAAPVPSGFRMDDGNSFVTLSFPAGVLTGDITGTFTERLDVVTHPDGSQNVHGNATCTCTVAGRTGTLFFHNIVGTTNTSGVSEAHFVLSGSGGLADLHGHGTAFVSPTPQGPFGVYTARYSFGR
jgi:hypothetical protein